MNKIKELQPSLISNNSREEMKQYWGDGPWQSEPDEFDFKYNGFMCLGRRGRLGTWCGYVLVPDSHPIFAENKNYDELDIEAHGGITYMGKCRKKKLDKKDYTWIGFDCCHSGDYWPARMTLDNFTKSIHNPELDALSKSLQEFQRMFPEHILRQDVYRTIDFVQNECKSIVEQLIKLEKKDGRKKHKRIA